MDLLQTCCSCCGLVDLLRWSWCNGFWPLVDRQYHGLDWPDTVRGCSAVTRSCNMEQDCICLQWFLTEGHEEEVREQYDRLKATSTSYRRMRHWKSRGNGGKTDVDPVMFTWPCDVSRSAPRRAPWQSVLADWYGARCHGQCISVTEQVSQE